MGTRSHIKQQLIKQTAIEIIVKDGLENFSINKLSKACGISVGTPYTYHKGKDRLIMEIFLEEGVKMEEAINKVLNLDASLNDGGCCTTRTKTA